MSDLRELAGLLATKDDSNTLGPTEFAVRDIALRVGAKDIETALEGRKKGATTGVAAPAPHYAESAKFLRWQAERAAQRV